MDRRTSADLGVATFGPLAEQLQAANLVRAPYLQNVSSSRATVRLVTREDRAPDARFTREPAGFVDEQTLTRVSGGFQHTMTLAGLVPDTNYELVVTLNGEVMAEPVRFRTPGAAAFSFLVFGDSGTEVQEQLRLRDAMSRESAALVLHTGDVVYPSGTLDRYEAAWFGVYGDMMRQMPFFPAPGNHDYHEPGLCAYRAVHDLPASGVCTEDCGRYYAFDWGPVHFICLDSNDPLQMASTGEGDMLRWLEDDLVASQAFWRIVYFHHPPYASGNHNADPLVQLARQHICPILERHGVQLVFNGHEHSYQRTVPIGNVVYVTSGGGGAPLYLVGPSPQIAASASSFHYLRCEVDGMRLTVNAIDVSGRVIDRFSLGQPPVLSEPDACDVRAFER